MAIVAVGLYLLTTQPPDHLQNHRGRETEAPQALVGETSQGERVHAQLHATPSSPPDAPSDASPFSAFCRGGCGTAFSSNYNGPAQDSSHKIRCEEDLKGEGFCIWMHNVLFGCAYTYYNCNGQTCPNAENHQ